MANYNDLKTGINAVIKTNGRQEISGAALNTQLKNMIAELGAGYQYMGVATPATNPGTPDANVFYLASEAGTYTNFGGIVINEGEVCVLVWNGTWTKQVTGIATAESVSQLGQDIEGNTVKPPVFINGFISSNGSFDPNDNYRCSSFLPCELIAYIANSVDAILNVNYYDENKVHQLYTHDSIIDGKLSLRSGYKYFRYWATVETIENNTLIPIKQKVENLNWLIPNTKYSGTVEVFDTVNNETIQASIGETTIDVTIAQKVFADYRENGPRFLYPQAATFTLSKTANLVCFGVIVNLSNSGDLGRYGYYVGDNNTAKSVINENEVFRPICVCRLYNDFEIRGGILAEAIKAYNLNKWTKYSGSVGLFSAVDDTTITSVIGSSTTEITIKNLIFSDRIHSYGYINPPQATLIVPSNANLVVIGVITGGASDRYAYYSSYTNLDIKENEAFRPICVCQLYNGEFKIVSGIIHDALSDKKLNDGLNSIIPSTVKEPSFKYGFISNTGDWYDNPDYKCSDLVPCDLIGGFKSAIASLIINLNFYNEDGSYAGHENASFVDGVAKLTTNYKYVRFWSTVANYDSVSIIWIKEYVDQQIQNLDLSDNKPSNIIYTNKCVSLDKLGAINLNNNQGAVPSEVLTLVSDGIQISQNYAFWPLINSRINNAWTRIIINTGSASTFILRNYGMENGAQGLTYLASFDIVNGTITFVGGVPISYTFDSDADYRIDIHRIDKFSQLFVTNLKTGITTSIDSYAGQTDGNTGLMYDIVAIGTQDENSIIVKSYNIESGVDEPKLMIFGDSITVGFQATCVDGINVNCYAHKIGEATGMNWLSSGRGGGAFSGFMGGTDNLGFTYEGRLWREIKKLRPNYVMVTLGTNGGGTYAQYKSVIDTIIKAGATPILNTLPIRADGDGTHNNDYIAAANQTIMQIWRDYGINGARFDLATSLNNDGDTINTSMFYQDLIHPNDAGHNAMYERALIDCPYLFI